MIRIHYCDETLSDENSPFLKISHFINENQIQLELKMKLFKYDNQFHKTFVTVILCNDLKRHSTQNSTIRLQEYTRYPGVRIAPNSKVFSVGFKSKD